METLYRRRPDCRQRESESEVPVDKENDEIRKGREEQLWKRKNFCMREKQRKCTPQKIRMY